MAELTTEQYNKAVEVIAGQYGPRMLEFLGRIVARLRKCGLIVDDPDDLSCDEFVWGTLVRLESKPGQKADELDLDLCLELAESLEHEGTVQGVTFRLDLTGVGGAVWGVWSPYNYSPEVWVDPLSAFQVAERVMELFSCEDGIVDRILTHVKKRASNG